MDDSDWINYAGSMLLLVILTWALSRRVLSRFAEQDKRLREYINLLERVAGELAGGDMGWNSLKHDLDLDIPLVQMLRVAIRFGSLRLDQVQLLIHTFRGQTQLVCETIRLIKLVLSRGVFAFCTVLIIRSFSSSGLMSALIAADRADFVLQHVSAFIVAVLWWLGMKSLPDVRADRVWVLKVLEDYRTLCGDRFMQELSAKEWESGVSQRAARMRYLGAAGQKATDRHFRLLKRRTDYLVAFELGAIGTPAFVAMLPMLNYF